MNSRINKIHLSIEKSGLEKIEYANENTDVIVEMSNGEVYVASFFTFGNLDLIRQQSKINGNYLSGKYFWAEKMVFLDSCSIDSIKEVIYDLIEEGNFEAAFRKL